MDNILIILGLYWMTLIMIISYPHFKRMIKQLYNYVVDHIVLEENVDVHRHMWPH